MVGGAGVQIRIDSGIGHGKDGLRIRYLEKVL